MSETPRGRDSQGRFINGNSGGPGRKPREIEREYLSKMESIVSGEAWEAIVQKATTDAIDGDAKARQWLSGYLLGMPVSRVEEEEKSNAIDEMIQQMREAGIDPSI